MSQFSVPSIDNLPSNDWTEGDQIADAHHVFGLWEAAWTNNRIGKLP
jgi:hypothetical protein